VLHRDGLLYFCLCQLAELEGRLYETQLRLEAQTRSREQGEARVAEVLLEREFQEEASAWKLKDAAAAEEMVRGYPFGAGCLPLSYSGNPGVDGVSDRGGAVSPKTRCCSTTSAAHRFLTVFLAHLHQ
jgi:hypothetical protein